MMLAALQCAIARQFPGRHRGIQLLHTVLCKKRKISKILQWLDSPLTKSNILSWPWITSIKLTLSLAWPYICISEGGCKDIDDHPVHRVWEFNILIWIFQKHQESLVLVFILPYPPWLRPACMVTDSLLMAACSRDIVFNWFRSVCLHLLIESVHLHIILNEATSDLSLTITG